MLKTKYFIIFLILAMITLVFYIFFPKSIKPDLDSNFSSNNIIKAPIETENSRELSKASNPDTTEHNETENIVFIETKKCFPKIVFENESGKNDSPLTVILNKVQPFLGNLSSSEFDWDNTHITLSNNEILRIRVFNDTTPEGKSVKKLEIYELDDEGLPLPTKIPISDSYNPSEKTVNDYISRGKVFYREKAYTLLFDEGSYIKVIETNKNVSEIEVHTSNKILKCSDHDEKNRFCECFEN